MESERPQSAKSGPVNALVFNIPDDAQANEVPRCKSCGYVLLSLTKPACPECGRSFNPVDRNSFDLRPPFMFWRYWLPGFVAAFAIGSLWSLLAYSFNELGCALFIGVPMAMAAFLAYGLRASVFWSIVAGVLAICILAFGLPAVLMAFDFTGIFCATSMVVFLVPSATFGAVLGWFLRQLMKAEKHFSQRGHLPLFTALLLMPGAIMLVEMLINPQSAIETVSTTQIIAKSQGDAFDSLMFYEQVPTEPPLLLRLGLPRVVKVMGSPDKVGQLTVCVYTKGRLVKRTTQVIQGERLAFDVIEQHNIESRSIRLIDGSFAFKAVTPETTEVTLTTTYQPLLRPRWMWRAIEHEAVHDLHEHVMNGMAAQERVVATREQQHAAAVLQP